MTDMQRPLADQDLSEEPVPKLVLDPWNPRVVTQRDGPPLTQVEIARQLIDVHDPEPIAMSMADFGFFKSEALIAFPATVELDSAYLESEGYAHDALVVAEGNRRLLAVRLLLDANLRGELGVQSAEWDAWSEHFLARNQDLNIPILEVENRSQAAPAIGYRHIIGIRKWGAFEKAAFVVSLINSGKSVDEVHRLTGEEENEIRRYIRDYRLLELADESGLDTAEAKENFGTFTRAMGQRGVRSYIGAPNPSEIVDPSEFVAATEPNNVPKLLSMLFGDDEGNEPVLTDSRKVKELGLALQNQYSREVLERTRDLTEAFEASEGPLRRVLSNVQRATNAIDRVADQYAAFSEESELQVALAGLDSSWAHLDSVRGR